MKITIEQGALSAALGMVAKAVSSKNTIPVLSGIYLNAQGNTLTLRATDMELAIEAAAECTVHTEGEIVLPARYLTDLIKRIPFGQIEMDVDIKNFTAAIRWGKSRYTVHGFPANQFPPSPDMEHASTLTMQQASLRDLLRQTTFAAGHDDSKPWLTGVLFKLTRQRLSGTATDGVRIANAGVEVVNAAAEGFSVIIPSRSLSEVGRLLSGDDEALTLSVTAKQVFFELGRVRIISRLLEGQYPDVMRLVPQAYPTQTTINRNAFLEALERALLIPKDNAVRLSLQDKVIAITSNTPEVGQVYEEVPTSELVGDPLEIGFNAKLIVDFLKNTDEPEFRLQCSGTRNPARLVPVSHTNFMYVVLPLITF